ELFRQAVQMAQVGLGKVVGKAEIEQLLLVGLPENAGITWATLTPTTQPPAWSGELVAGDKSLGWYSLGERKNGISYNQAETTALNTLTKQAALALAYANTLDNLNTLNHELEQQVAQRTTQLLLQQRALTIGEERQRLARDLHDSVTQTLFSLSLGARALRKGVRRDIDATELGLREQEASAQQALAEMRQLLEQLRHPVADLGKQVVDLAALVRSHVAQIGLDVALEMPASLPLPAFIAHELLFIIREALHNVLKHSGVRVASCCLEATPTEVQVVVADEGQGFEVGARLGKNAGMGLANMRYRTQQIGGTIELISRASGGTVVKIFIPI
ncbi:MAG: sensor histidine kinase, partial [Methylococcales bacterium]|nr:sensor histidine kinase [Methylococcales bacterium]